MALDKGIKSGGAVVNQEDKLRTQLIRSTADIKKVGDGAFGLVEWYPARKGRPPGEGGRTARAASLTELAELGDEGGDQEHQESEEENASPDANE